MTMNYNPSEKETEQIRKSLFEFNAGKVGDDGHTPLNIIEYLYYPMGILVMALFSIFARWPKKYS